MHVMLVAPEDLPIPPTRGGSVQIYLSHLCAALADRKHIHITLISPGNAAQSKACAHPPYRHIVVKGDKKTYWRRVHRLVKAGEPDVVQIDNRPLEALHILAANPHRRVVLNLHSLTFLGPRHIKTAEARTILHKADAVVCNSRNLAETIARRYKLKHNWQRHVIYPGVHSTAHTSALTRGHSTDTMRVLFVGRVIRQKGVHIAIEAIRQQHRQNNVSLTIVGKTHTWEKTYRKQIELDAKGLPIEFVGFVPPHELAELYKKHHLLICPSQKHEAFGLVNIEAMNHGLPVIASKLGGIPEAVGKHGGVLVSRYQMPGEFAKAIDKMRDPKRYYKMSKYALRHAQKFTWKKTARKFDHLYRDICQAR